LLSHARIPLESLDIYNFKNLSVNEDRNEAMTEEYNDPYTGSSLYRKHTTDRGRAAIIKEIAKLKEELIDLGSLSTDEWIEKEDQLKKLEKYLQERPVQDIDPNVKKARVSIYKAINTALNKIQEESTFPISSHLNNTIKTGYKCIYNPPDHDKPAWILDPKDLDP